MGDYVGEYVHKAQAFKREPVPSEFCTALETIIYAKGLKSYFWLLQQLYKP